jgi:hypothetical protein
MARVPVYERPKSQLLTIFAESDAGSIGLLGVCCSRRLRMEVQEDIPEEQESLRKSIRGARASFRPVRPGFRTSSSPS